MNGDSEMNECEYGRKISAAYDEEIPEEERRQLEQHMRQCPRCRRELRQIRALSELLRDLYPPSMSADFASRVHESLSGVNPLPAVLCTARRLTAVAATVLVGCVVWLWQFDAVGAGSAGVPAQWERVIISARDEGLSEASQDELLAQWIIEDLDREGNGD